MKEILLKLENEFSNISKSNQHSAVYDSSFKVVDHIGNESAEIFYSSHFNEWAIILDNFPGQRKHFSWTVPIKDFETINYLFVLCGINLKPKILSNV